MTVEVAQQGRALGQAILLGLALGGVYDLFRILRVRVHLPFLGAVLDLLFWLTATTALFVWSQDAWGGEIRLYGCVFCMAGGGAYFWLVSPWMLRLGYRLADFTAVVLSILTAPVRLLGVILKKIRKLVKNVFLFGVKWYRIRNKTGGMEQTFRRRSARERGEQP